MVSLMEYDGTPDAFFEAIELCRGLEKLKPGDRILIKPNGVGADPAMPYFGMMTTVTAVEAVVQLLLDHGCSGDRITIGEGGAASREFNLNTLKVLKAMGMERIRKRYGVNIVDFNTAPQATVDCGRITLDIARPALETDFLINMPVPKYHEQTLVSLSLKNLKGCISPQSKRKCHSVKLQENIAAFNTQIPCHLTVMDGIYFLRHGGPFIDSGVPCRKNMIMAGADRIELDSAACKIMGVDPRQVGHIAEYARLVGREQDLGKVEWVGDDRAPFQEPPYKEDKELFYNSFKNARISGLKLQHPGQTWCTGCNISLRAALYLLCKDNVGHDFGGVEILCGKQTKSQGDYEKTILFGDCPNKVNRKNAKIKNRLEIPDCPPSFFKSYPQMARFILPRRKANAQIAKNMALGALTRLGLARIEFPFLADLPGDVFDPRDFGRKA